MKSLIYQNNDLVKKRIVLLFLGLFFLFSILLARYFQIQVLEGDRWEKEALIQHEFIIKEPFRRGTFYSNTTLTKGHTDYEQPLAIDVTKFHLYIDPLAIPNRFKEEICETLLTYLSQKNDALRKEFDRNTRSRRLFKWLSKDSKEIILSWWKPYAKEHKIPLNALFFVTDYKRAYPFGSLLGQVLHTIREDKDENTLRAFPTGGLESFFNDILEGKPGERKLLRSPFHRLDIDKCIKFPQNGADIYLTVNHFIQNIVEQELEKGVLLAKAKGGWAVMMDPFSGEIFALAQYPFFTPSNYKDFFNDKEKVEQTKIKSISDCFEIGSIMKPITVALALKANEELSVLNKPSLFFPNDPIDVTRTLFPGRAKYPLRDISRNKCLNMYMALQKSSNIYMAQLADRIVNFLGAEWYSNSLTNIFGFGTLTGIELPGESPGKLPYPWKQKQCNEWSLATPYSLAIGYNISATALQMVRAYSVLINGGYLVKPTLVKKIVSSIQGPQETSMCADYSQLRNSIKVLSKEISDTLVKAMKYTTSTGGTGTLAALKDYTTAGKTSTAEKIIKGQYSKNTHLSSFIGFAPANLNKSIRPRFVLLISIDEPAHIILPNGLKGYMGGRCAANVFGAIAQRTLEFLGVPPDKNDELEKTWSEEVKKLKVLYEEWNRK